MHARTYNNRTVLSVHDIKSSSIAFVLTFSGRDRVVLVLYSIYEYLPRQRSAFFSEFDAGWILSKILKAVMQSKTAFVRSACLIAGATCERQNGRESLKQIKAKIDHNWLRI